MSLSPLSIVTEITFDEALTELDNVRELIEATEAENEDSWTPEMVAGWDAQAVQLNKKVAIVAESIEWYEIEDEEIKGMAETMKEQMIEYAEFRAYVKECKGW